MIWHFSKSQQKLWNDGGWSCKANSNPVAGHNPIENGTYAFDQVEYNEPTETSYLESEGPYFIPINVNNQKGLHGGGSGLEHPLAAQQGWYPTEGCIRVQNIDLYHIVVSLSTGDTITITD